MDPKTGRYVREGRGRVMIHGESIDPTVPSHALGFPARRITTDAGTESLYVERLP
jgi:hypothetical protein